MVKFTNGDSVEITTKDKTFSGIYIESNKKDVVTIKLSSGYNIGVNKKEVKKIKLIKKNKKSNEVKKIKVKKGLKKISILHMGGTIASTVDYKTGAVSPRFNPDEIINMFPELNEIATINSRLIGNMWSHDFRFIHFNIIAKEVKKEIDNGAKGVIVTLGTDFLHYTSAALAFALENLSVPVLLVGSQRSSDRGGSDAGFNLINAVYFAVHSDMCDVGICMHNSMSDDYCAILPGLKTRKMHTSRRDAFKAINAKPWALVDYRRGEIKYVDKVFNRENKGKLNLKIFNALKILTKKTVVVLAAQTIFGRLNMNVYSNQREMQEIGILGHLNDMTPETTFVKLSWLLSNYKKDAKDLLFENLKGEINERLMSDEFLDESF